MAAEKVTDEKVAQNKRKPHRSKDIEEVPAVRTGWAESLQTQLSVRKERTPRKAEERKRGENGKGPFFPETGFLCKGLNLSHVQA